MRTNVQDARHVRGHIGAVEALPGFVLAAVALAGSPGPATLSLTATGAAFGARRGAAYLAGIVVGMVAVMAIVASGLVGLLLAVPGATPVVTVLAAAYFLYLAWRIATAPPLADDGGQRRAPTFAGGLLLSLVNPKGYAAMAALFSGFVLMQERLVLDVAVKMAAAFRDHHGRQRRVAAGRRGADALLPRAAHQPGDQRDVRRAARGLGDIRAGALRRYVRGVRRCAP